MKTSIESKLNSYYVLSKEKIKRLYEDSYKQYEGQIIDHEKRLSLKKDFEHQVKEILNSYTKEYLQELKSNQNPALRLFTSDIDKKLNKFISKFASKIYNG